MNLKKFSGVVLSCILAGSIFTGCGNDLGTADSPNTRIGIITKLNASEEQLNEHLKQLEKVSKVQQLNISHNYHYYEGLNELIMGIDAKQIDEISTYRSVANYVVAKNSNIEILNHTVNMFDSFCCAVRKDDKNLGDEINSAIMSMQNDGTLENLTKIYITDFNPNENPPAVAMPHFDGAENIKVGVTGDLPPLDLVLTDGTPAGFNTAVLAEISKRINKNIELVTIDSNARASALNSRVIDIVFWVTVPGEFWTDEKAGNAPQDIDKPADLEISAPYYKDEIVHIALKK